MTDSQPMDPIDAFGRLSRIKLAETDLKGVLNEVAELARRTIPGAEEVSVTLIDKKEARTAAYTGQLALDLDELQYGEGRGPCIDASAQATTLSLPDMSTEGRWPEWAARATRTGVHSSLSIGLPMHEQISGALNVYATEAKAFDDDAVSLGQTFAGYAAVALTNAHLYDAQTNLAQQMQTAMQSRAVIEQAKGIIIGSRHCTAEEAFAILTRISQDTNRKLRDVAIALVASASPNIKP
ncbi:GAF and ANTAR domain-containing protein [Paractinoplanes toevensis]|uniref:Transcriptional regulator n=1 Tax=Paractinoplanes toevensis TaxID=571911 RepID=A0A919T6K3_9ACTN|nr:GAF and ANTAR domain-containing protein [Actinoplanes toevensis]GIM89970.1 transcriptional regulator [Actinoplanes toevensis]